MPRQDEVGGDDIGGGDPSDGVDEHASAESGGGVEADGGDCRKKFHQHEAHGAESVVGVCRAARRGRRSQARAAGTGPMTF